MIEHGISWRSLTAQKEVRRHWATNCRKAAWLRKSSYARFLVDTNSLRSFEVAMRLSVLSSSPTLTVV